MVGIHKRALQAAPGPRIAANRDSGRSLDELLGATGADPPRRARLPQGPEDLGVDSWMDLLPWSLSRPRSRHRLVAVGLLTLLAVVFLVTGLHAGLVLATVGLAGIGLWRELRSPERRASRILDGIEAEIAGGGKPAALLPCFERALEADPDNDGARFLLACLLFEEGRYLSALLQLAPLRDHHPDVGEVVLLAAAAYANLELNEDALRLLAVLDIDSSHPSFPAAALLYRRAQPAPRRGAALQPHGPVSGPPDSTRMSS